MLNRPGLSWAAVLLMTSGCAGVSAAQRQQWESAAAPSASALSAGRIDEATAQAKQALAKDPENSRASAVLAVSLYRTALHDLVTDVVTVGGALIASGALEGGFFSTDLLVFAFKRADERFDEVDRALAAAAKDPEVSLELCLACWEVDWNRNGQVDERDLALLQVELDAEGQPLPEADPRRRPTFRFDAADVHWLRAMVSFQRAALNLAQGWDWQALAPALGRRRNRPDELRVPLRDAPAVKKARELILAGLAESRACRTVALAETDDEREWLPNPRQKSHAIPLPVDDALYQTWALVVDDLEKLFRGEEALPASEVARVALGQRSELPTGLVNLGKWLGEPSELVVPLGRLEELERPARLELLLQQLFGAAYSRQGRASALPGRLERMQAEVKVGQESFEKKLRYLLWVN